MTLSPASPADAVIAHLKSLRREENRAGMARFGIETTTALGISNAELRRIARAIRHDHRRALLDRLNP